MEFEDLTLVVLPGLNGTGELFDAFFEAFPANVSHSVIAYPSGGLGGFEDYRNYVVERLSAYSSYVLLAESFSGPLAVHALANLREAPRALIICASFLQSPKPKLLSLNRLMPFGRLLKAVSRFKRGHSIFLGEDVTDETIAKFSVALNSLPPKLISERLRVLGELPPIEDAGTSSIPMCYLQSKRDLLVSTSAARDFQKVFSDMEVRRVGTSHFILQTRPLEAVQEICSFLKSALA